MNLLLDTHAVLWWLEAHTRLSPQARGAISDPANRCCVSAVSVFEMETKHRLGKLTLPGPLQVGWDAILSAEKWEALSVSLSHARHAGLLPGSHADPFDRLLAAQAEIDGLTLVTCDPAFVAFGIRTLW
ncbi:MAG: type II toxin-antitoxin system VapC family toxin [Opitutaceae bacterium]